MWYILETILLDQYLIILFTPLRQKNMRVSTDDIGIIPYFQHRLSNRIMMKQVLSLICLIGMTTSLLGQAASYNRTAIEPIKPQGVVNVSSLDDQYLFNLVNVETQDASSHLIKSRLIDVKEGLKTTHPKKDVNVVNTRADSDPPVVMNGFFGHLSAPGIPLDNHLASNGEQIIIGMNSNFSMRTIEGNAIIGFSLDHFAAEVGLEGFTFDPRVHYDPAADRYVGVFLHGNESSDTGIGIMFSQTNDMTGDWAVYSLPGNPFSNTTWTDYPMINVTDTDLIITVNLIRDAEPWETGFEETILWQLDKSNGYANEDMNSIMWNGLTFDGTSLRNLCPMESADEVHESNTYYLSNRNFDVENDTIFFVELTGGVNDASAELRIEALVADVPYGAPPNADQAVGFLQTNDARVLEGFYHNDQIQFVGNSRNPINNKAGIFHGIINNVTGSRDLTLEHIIPENLEIGYPGITYTGVDNLDLDAIIHFSHSSVEVSPGVSAMYYHPVDGYSDIVEVVAGDNYIDQLTGEVERWGDYAGSQREFNNPGLALISGTVGRITRVNHPWVARLARPQFTTSTDDDTIIDGSLDVFPNPVHDRVTFKLDIPEDAPSIQVTITDINGQVIDIIKDGAIHKTGKSEMSFATRHLPSGMYTVTVVSRGHPILTETFVRQ